MSRWRDRLAAQIEAAWKQEGVRLEIAGEPITTGARVAYRKNDRVYLLAQHEGHERRTGVALDTAEQGEPLRVEYDRQSEPFKSDRCRT